jgi:hypothetical protein
VSSYHQSEVPQTPVTLVSAEALISLHNIIKQDALMLNKTSIPRLQRHVQKLANAAQMSLAQCALLDNEKQLFTRMNNEAKVRRSTKSVVLGKAKVMSYEDIEEARIKRAAKDATNGKGKRDRKRKSIELEADKPEPDEPDEPEPKPQVARIIEAPGPWRAPVARMY